MLRTLVNQIWIIIGLFLGEVLDPEDSALVTMIIPTVMFQPNIIWRLKYAPNQETLEMNFTELNKIVLSIFPKYIGNSLNLTNWCIEIKVFPMLQSAVFWFRAHCPLSQYVFHLTYNCYVKVAKEFGSCSHISPLPSPHNIIKHSESILHVYSIFS
jgi:hypothetical protein